jgi:3-oxoacyl-[acyl-carrier protein] reductase
MRGQPILSRTKDAYMGQLDGKVAIITGATKGIGRSISKLFASEGCGIVGVGRTEQLLSELGEEIAFGGGAFRGVVGDVRYPAAADRSVEEALSRFGQIDILVCNAGIAVFEPIWSLSADDYDDLMDTNMRGTFLFVKAVVPTFLKQAKGDIICISSLAGVRGYPELTAYCATKFAQVGFMMALDQELRPHNIRVSTVLAGSTATEIAMGRGRTPEMLAEGHYLMPDDVARAVLLAATQPGHSRIPQISILPSAEPF